MATYAVIDVGTNSIKFHLAEKQPEGQWAELLDTSEIARLGDGLATTDLLREDAIWRNVHAIAEMVQIARQHNVADIVAVGTMCLRIARNADDFIDQVARACGVQIEILTGLEEAHLAYLGVKSGMIIYEEPLLIFDVGGGSTECLIGQHDQIERAVSLNAGAVLYTEQYLTADPVTPADVQHACAMIERDLNVLRFHHPISTVIGIGGTVTTLSAVKYQLTTYDPGIVHGSILDLPEIERQIALYQEKTVSARRQIAGLPPKRADVILAGALIVKTLLHKAGVQVLTVSDRGVRHGALLDRFGP